METTKKIDVHETAIQAIERGNQQWAEAFRTQNPDLLASLFSDDGAMLSSNGNVYQGYEAIKHSIGAWMNEMGPAEMTIETTGTWLLDNIAHETGNYEYRFHEKETGKLAKQKGKYVVLWKSQPDGSWKIFRDIGVP